LGERKFKFRLLSEDSQMDHLPILNCSVSITMAPIPHLRDFLSQTLIPKDLPSQYSIAVHNHVLASVPPTHSSLT
jgi:hypothetical protein